VTESAPPFPVLTGPPFPHAAAVLHHTGGAQGDHFDVLLATRTPDGEDDLTCATWRTANDPGTLAAGQSTTAERIGAHRAAYLALTAPRELSDGRGVVTPVRSGTWRPHGTDGITIDLHWSDGTRTRIAALPTGLWKRIDA
jgi:hypothetical protein